MVCDDAVMASKRLDAVTCQCIDATVPWQATGSCSCSSKAIVIKNANGLSTCLECNAAILAKDKSVKENTCTCQVAKPSSPIVWNSNKN